MGSDPINLGSDPINLITVFLPPTNQPLIKWGLTPLIWGQTPFLEEGADKVRAEAAGQGGQEGGENEARDDDANDLGQQ
jgi:hypothetical protein